MALSSPGIGSNLDINSIIKQLMSVESQPLVKLASKEASFQAKLSAYGSVSGALGAFQTALSGLSTPTKFQALTANSGDAALMTASATSNAVAGNYDVQVTHLAQAQTLATSGKTTTTDVIGSGTLTFQFGTISLAGSTLSNAVAVGGIPAGSLTINGTTIVTSSATTSAKALATQINLSKSATGVTATAQTTTTGSLGAFTVTSGAATYKLDVGGVNIITDGAIGTDGAAIDTRLVDATVAANLAAAGINFSGSAAAGTLAFTRADGSNVDVQESGAGAAGGFTTSIGIGTTRTFTGAVYLSPGNATIGGTDPTLAGFTAGSMPDNGIYTGTAFTQDAAQATGSVTIDSTNNSLQGIRDAINAAKLGVTATIVSDGSASPYHLVLTSDKTGETSSMKITVSGDAALQDLLAYDPADPAGQNLTESSAAKNTTLSVNGIAISSTTRTVNEAIQGVTLTLSKTGSTTLSVARDTASVTAAVNGFVKAYNDINKTLVGLTAYNASTKQGGLLIGDATIRSVQTGLRRIMTSSIAELSGNVKTLSDVGVAFQKDGTVAVDSAKLQNAITNNFSDIAAIFASIGTSTDSLTSFLSSTTATKAGNYAVNLTQVGTQGNLVGNLDLNTGSTVIAASTSLNVTLDGETASVALTAGSYTAAQIAAMIQSAINGTSAFSTLGSTVKASIDGNGYLSILSERYGSTSELSITSGTGTTADTLFGAGPTSTTGVDVAGTIGGVTATGSGQKLTGAAGSLSEGLALLMTGSASGDRGTLTFTRGYADQLGTLVETFLGSSGLISARTDGISSSIKDIGKTRDAIGERLIAVEKRYRAQFTALDLAISSMTKTSDFLTQQLSNLPGSGGGNN